MIKGVGKTVVPGMTKQARTLLFGKKAGVGDDAGCG